MEKIILVDGTNLVFRSYYATAYTGNLMKNSKDVPTNAVFGFANMINKIIADEKPTYMIVAFDKGKTFRHEKYKDYKAGRSETPSELLQQIPLCKQLLEALGIKYYELDNYEADDIIGTFAKYCDEEENFVGTIISSDKDLLQLISKDVDMKLLKPKGYIRYNLDNFQDDWHIQPENIIDLKALMGDSSDNIPGVAGIGEKTAMKLLEEYKTLDNIYQNIDKVKGKLHDKLINDKDNAYMSYDLATINKEAPVQISLKDIKMKEKDEKQLVAIYEDLEFYSLLKKEQIKSENTTNPVDDKIDVTIIENIDQINITEPSSAYLEILGTNYHTSPIIGLAVYNPNMQIFIPSEILKESLKKLKNIDFTYDYKKMYVAFKWLDFDLPLVKFDTMIAAYLLDYNIKDDISYFANNLDYSIPFYDNEYYRRKEKWITPTLEESAITCIKKAKFIYETKDSLNDRLEKENIQELYYDIELPLSRVLGKMEYDGVNLDISELDKMKEEISIKVELLEKDIYNMAGTTFNIASPKQLGDILFETLNLPHGKKSKRGYSTSAEVLEQIKDVHPIINKILDYRMLTKLYATYIEGLKNSMMPDNKIHTIFTNTLTRTGRLSSIEPNLQNIPIRTEYGRLIRKAFIPSDDSIIISGDYSQIELRILAHMANVPSLIEAFKNDIDIHTKTASDLFKVSEVEVNNNMRRIAKAVNFGIVYGISSYGLSSNIHTSVSEAKKFIDNYLSTYPGIKEYMDSTIEKAHELGYVTTLFNRKRFIPELNNKNYMIRQSAERIALNTPIQGTSADIIKKAMINIHNRFEKENIKSRMILQVHDELVFDTLNEEKEKVINIIKEEMEGVLKISVPLKVDIEYGDNWYQAK